MKIFLLKHADDPHDIIGGWSSIQLTDLGIRQAEEIKKFFITNKTTLNIKHIISSDLIRAKQTIIPTALGLDINIEYSPLWRGLNQGELNGCSTLEVKKLYPYLNLAMLEYNDSFPHGESPKQFYERVINEWNKILSAYKRDNILICTHGINMMAIHSLLTNTIWEYKVQKNYYPGVLMEIDLDNKKIHTKMLVNAK